MMTLSKTEETKLRKAGAKAKAEKPLVRKTDLHNVWLVRSSDKSTFYTVTFTKGDKPGELKAECTCANSKKGKAHNCKHPLSVYDFYKLAVVERASAREAANWAATVCEICGGLAGGMEADEEHNTCKCGPAPATPVLEPVVEKYLLDCPHCDGCFVSENKHAFLCPDCNAAQLTKDEADLFGVAV